MLDPILSIVLFISSSVLPGYKKIEQENYKAAGKIKDIAI